MPTVSFSYADVPLTLPNNKKALKAFIESVFIQEGHTLSQLNYIFCSDEYLLQINKDFLQHDYYTDIITFDLSEARENGIIGEVYISADRVKDNAGQNKVSKREELLRVIFHGALHLCGYRDKKKSEITLMREKEDYYLRLFEKQMN
ncbi:MAG: ybeY [Segetibacter sp.]|nr:ybeY [Segetibacter sp.]